MTTDDDERPLIDHHAGTLIRPYAISNGRTRPSKELDLMSLVMDTGAVPLERLDPEHGQVLALCRGPISVAEVAARLRLPVMVAKILLCDLIDCGAATTRAPFAPDDQLDRSVLEAVLDGLRQRL